MRSSWFSILIAVLLAALTFGCRQGARNAGAASLTGGDPQRGLAAIGRYGCGSCHTIPGVTGAHGLVGPALSGIGSRMYVGGVLYNTPDNLVSWIRDPKAADDKTAMPVLCVSENDATDI